MSYARLQRPREEKKKVTKGHLSETFKASAGEKGNGGRKPKRRKAKKNEGGYARNQQSLKLKRRETDGDPKNEPNVNWWRGEKG